MVAHRIIRKTGVGKTPNSNFLYSPDLLIQVKQGLTQSASISMQMVPAPAFQLPDGWVLEVRPRANSTSGGADKYYYEPHTGRQFRSLASIKRYLDGEEESPRPRRIHQQGALNVATYRRGVVYKGKLWKLGEESEAAGQIPRPMKNAGTATVQHRASSLLPDGWIVEEVPRKSGFRIDTYFIEPMTRRKFRSVPEVLRYLTADDDDDDEYAAKFKPMKMIHPNPTSITIMPPPPPPRGSCPCKEALDLAVNSENFDMVNLPDQITWTLMSTETTNSASGRENWIPFVEESRIPDHVKQVWQDIFFLGMTGSRKHQIPQLAMGEPA